MKKTNLLILFIIFFAVSFTVSSNKDLLKIYSTYCEQTFHFFFLSEGSPTFWIGENLSGECEISYLFNISIRDSNVSVSKSELKEYNKWDEVKNISDFFRKYKELDDNNLVITPPQFDPGLRDAFNKHVVEGGSNGYTWNKKHGIDGIVLPNIENLKIDLLFYHQGGLYINYNIASVHYFPDTRLILIFTEQPLRAVGMDTMHGFFIFEIMQT
jgi:hypothetical protein